MKTKTKIFFIIFFSVFILFLNNTSYAGSQRWKALDYDVQLNEDGSMRVTENWNIYISETNTLFKDFEMDSRKYSGITDVTVEYGGRQLENINQEMYHVTKNCFYALPISGNKFEIAWGVGLDNASATRNYKISYTVKDVISVYDDCSEMYWMFLNNQNGISADKVTGRIKLPSPVDDIEKLRVWAHGPLNGEIYKTSNDTVEFWVDDLSSNTMLETRVVVEEDIFPLSDKIFYKPGLENILKEEKESADKANRERNKIKFIHYAIDAVLIIIFVFYFTKIIKYIQELIEAKRFNNENKIENFDIGRYFRDIPREKDSTPAEAAFLYYSNKNSFSINAHLDKVFSATLLQLCLKKYISFDVTDKKDIKINLIKDIENEELSKSEKTIYDILKVAKKAENDFVTMDEIKKYATKKYDSFHEKMDSIAEDAKNRHIEARNFDKDIENKVKSFNTKVICYISGLIFSICFAGVFLILLFIDFISLYIVPSILIEWLISVIILKISANQYRILTEQGETERQEWKALKNYMEDFSLLKEREVPDLVLWEKYLVYATDFGISDKVLKQLKVVYPQIDNLSGSDYTYLYLMSDNRFNNNFLTDFSKMTQSAYNSYKSAYNSAHSSSSGGGGGFSSGGGGRRRRRKLWR